ncbi:TraQ conjugal transfer family protein [Porphyromonas gingivalis]|uniref:TraQ conjugal transfer family protein n=1 Tax=Porphyromonas gingivalis TaxID=837 RepID=UPI0021D44365|nr:TraL conjugative transposon family protein [Porphyromonas gingivalis]
MREGAEARLRRLCGRIPTHLRLYVVLTMLLFFAILANYVFYTSASTDQQTIDVYVEDNFGQKAKLSFEFNSQKDEEKEKKDEVKK